MEIMEFEDMGVDELQKWLKEKGFSDSAMECCKGV